MSELPRTTPERSLWIALGLTGGFMVAEVVAGVAFGSLALISDAAHMLTDATALAIALAAIRIGRRPADDRRTYGYRRFEILAAAFNALLLFVVAAYVIYEAVGRLSRPVAVESTGMLVVAALGLAVNFVSMRLLRGGQGASLNLKGAYLEVWSDFLGSIGVIAGAIAIKFTGLAWIDPMIAVAIGLWVLPRTWMLLRESLNVLLEGVPEGIDLNAVSATLEAIPGVRGVHDLHVWAITSGQTSLSAHLVLTPQARNTGTSLIHTAARALSVAHSIEHVTLQCEGDRCPSVGDDLHDVERVSVDGSSAAGGQGAEPLNPR